ncbi:MAG: hypothetical protein M1819_003670 [Sarea resinae]|nr:MAG: hypothetical protein M1819_003670 [Sarea resinae]
MTMERGACSEALTAAQYCAVPAVPEITSWSHARWRGSKSSRRPMAQEPTVVEASMDHARWYHVRRPQKPRTGLGNTLKRGMSSNSPPTYSKLPRNVFSRSRSSLSFATPQPKPGDEGARPHYFSQIPWAGISASMGVILCAVASAIILAVSNGDLVDSWTVQPTVWLAVLSAVANTLLSFAFHEGATIIWWRKSLQGGSLDEIHRTWSFGDSLLASVKHARHFRWISFARIMATLAMIDGPLLQRASTVTTHNVTTPVNMTMQIATGLPVGYSGFATGLNNNFFPDQYSVPLLTPNFAGVMSGYTNRVPMTPLFSGCSGDCLVTVKAFGLVPSCSNTTKSINYGAFLVSGNNSEQNFEENAGAKTLFETAFDIRWGLETNETGGWPANLTYHLTYTVADPDRSHQTCEGAICDCPATATERTCVLRRGIVEYSLRLSNTSAVFVGDSTEYKADTVLPWDTFDIANDEHGDARGGEGSAGGTTIIGGFQDAAQAAFGSEAEIVYGALGRPGSSWRYNSTGSLSSQYIDSAYDNWQNFGYWCNFSYNDPTKNILQSLNEISFRSAINATNSSTPAQTVLAMQTTTKTFYKSHFKYLWGALALMIFSVLVVTPTLYGWWDLDRKFTLDPIEMARAFDAPLLRDTGGRSSKVEVRDVLREIGWRKVQYRDNVFRELTEPVAMAEGIGLRRGEAENEGEAGDEGEGDLRYEARSGQPDNPSTRDPKKQKLKVEGQPPSQPPRKKKQKLQVEGQPPSQSPRMKKRKRKPDSGAQEMPETPTLETTSETSTSLPAAELRGLFEYASPPLRFELFPEAGMPKEVREIFNELGKLRYGSATIPLELKGRVCEKVHKSHRPPPSAYDNIPVSHGDRAGDLWDLALDILEKGAEMFKDQNTMPEESWISLAKAVLQATFDAYIAPCSDLEFDLIGV